MIIIIIIIIITITIIIIFGYNINNNRINRIRLGGLIYGLKRTIYKTTEPNSFDYDIPK